MHDLTKNQEGRQGRLVFDPDKLREKYRAERSKRLRSDGNDQYRAASGQLARYLDDPYVVPGFARQRLADDIDVLLIGGGFGGLLAAARLRQAGIDNIRIIEKAGDFGGTWYWNRYPGIACDIESYIYMPLLEELDIMPTEKYARGSEILEHCKRIGRHYGLYERACFQTEVSELRWDDVLSRWIVSTNRGDAFKARFVCMSTGPLHRPKLPAIPGIENFKGHSFHTSRWDYDYTGGDEAGGMTRLRDKRVGIIGTGASSVQCIPHLGASAKQLYVFQRTPSAINVRGNRPTDAAWVRTLKPGWQRTRMDNFNILVSGGAADEDLVGDGWTDILGRIGRGGGSDEAQLADFTKMEKVRARVDSIVRDPATAEGLKPYYNQMCKRPCFHDEYLQTFNRPNVALVDTAGRGVESVGETVVVANGQQYEVDCLIFGTGFEFRTAFARRVGYEIYGRGGFSLSEKWKNGISSLYGMHTRGFPNCFIMGNAQIANTPNFTHMLDVMGNHVAYVVRACLDRGARTVEPSAEGERAWVDEVSSFESLRHKFDGECTPGYYNNEGMPLPITNGVYLGGSLKYIRLLQEWRDQDQFAGFEVSEAL